MRIVTGLKKPDAETDADRQGQRNLRCILSVRYSGDPDLLSPPPRRFVALPPPALATSGLPSRPQYSPLAVSNPAASAPPPAYSTGSSPEPSHNSASTPAAIPTQNQAAAAAAAAAAMEDSHNLWCQMQ
ncbi:hypothetical protein ABVT39_026889 [Epinephelus coioides]